jgi:hypothetical protein
VSIGTPLQIEIVIGRSREIMALTLYSGISFYNPAIPMDNGAHQPDKVDFSIAFEIL